MFRCYGSTSFRNETVPKHCVNTKNSKRQKRRRYKAEQSETFSLHYFHRSGTAPFLAPKRSEPDVNSDLSVTITVSKWFGTVTSEHGLSMVIKVLENRNEKSQKRCRLDMKTNKDRRQTVKNSNLKIRAWYIPRTNLWVVATSFRNHLLACLGFRSYPIAWILCRCTKRKREWFKR